MKKTLLLTLCASMLLSCLLAGCTDKPDEPVGTTSSVTTAEVTDTVATEEETTDSVTTDTTDTTADEEDTAEPQPEIGISRSLSSVTIVSGESAPEAYAAAELQKYLEMKGVSVVEDGYPITLRIDSDLGDDSYKIAVFRKNKDGATITGGNGRGVIYGVYRFLEEYGGVRFFTSDLEVVPTGSLKLTTGVLEQPAIFEYRLTNWYGGQSKAFSLKSGINHNDGALSEDVGGGWSYGGFVHTMSALTGTPSDSQPCLTDEENLQKAIAGVRAILASNPTVKIVSVSQNDNYDRCICKNCTAIDTEEGSPAGTLLRFVNAVAADIAEDYPDVVIDTLAYQYTRKAPAITRPLPNVCIRLCSIECCFAHALSDDACPQNLAFSQDLVEWGKICNRIYVWDYTTNFSYYLSTFENLDVLRENMRFYAEHNVKGMFAQGNSESVSGEFGELRRYLLGKLLMEPMMSEVEYETHMEEFLQAYYGDGWRYVLAFINATSGLPGRECRGIYAPPLNAVPKEWYSIMESTFDDWWDKAEELAGDRLAYVQRSRLQWRYTKLFLHPNEEEAKALIEDVVAADIMWREWKYEDYPAKESDLSRTPDYWIYN